MFSLNAKYVFTVLSSSQKNKEPQTTVKELQSFKETERSDHLQKDSEPQPAQRV